MGGKLQSAQHDDKVLQVHVGGRAQGAAPSSCSFGTNRTRSQASREALGKALLRVPVS